MPALVTPLGERQSGGLASNASPPDALAPAKRVVVIVVAVPAGSTGWIVRLGCTVPCNATAAAAPVVWYLMIVRVPSAQSATAMPSVVLFEHPPVPVEIGSVYATPPTLYVPPAWTFPVAGAGSLD